MGELVRAVVVVPVLTAISVLVALLVDATVARYGPQWVLKAPRRRGQRGVPGRAQGCVLIIGSALAVSSDP